MRILARATMTLRRIVDLALIGLILVVLIGVLLGKVVPLTGRQSIVVGGHSMEPALSLGAALVINPVPATALAVGDIVSMQVGPQRTTFTHRIVAVVDRPDGRWIRTKGDANAAPDPTLVPASAVIGRVELAIPLLGYLLALLSLPVGVLFILGIAATLLAIAWLLESLEAEKVETWIVDGASLGPRSRDGEPMSARSGGPARLATASGTVSPGGLVTSSPTVARPTIAEQLAHSRETRARRSRWLARPGRVDGD